MTNETEMVPPEANKLVHCVGEGILLHVIQTNRKVAATTGYMHPGLGINGEYRAEVMA